MVDSLCQLRYVEVLLSNLPGAEGPHSVGKHPQSVQEEGMEMRRV